MSRPDIYTFVDASVGVNQYTKTYNSAYGFVHMSTDIHSGVLYAWSFGVQTSDERDIHTLEAAAIYLALTDIRRLSNHNNIAIITDSNKVYNRMKAIIDSNQTVSCFDWAKSKDPTTRLVLQCVDSYRQAINIGYRLDMKLCKSHVKPIDQFHLVQKQDPTFTDFSYAKDICYGNSVIDYNVNYVACNMNPAQVQQYGNGSPLLESSCAQYESIFW